MVAHPTKENNIITQYYLSLFSVIKPWKTTNLTLIVGMYYRL